MRKKKTLFRPMTKVSFVILFFFLTLSFGQDIDSIVVKDDPLIEFQEKQTSKAKFDYFNNTPNPFSESSAYDWLETVTVYKNSAEKMRDSLTLRRYQLIESKIYQHLGDYPMSLSLAKEVYVDKSKLDSAELAETLNILDDNYHALRMFDNQITIRTEKKENGFSDKVEFYDVYEDMGMYRRAMEEYIISEKSKIDENNFFEKAQYHNKIGNYLRLDNSASTAIAELNKANGFLEIYNNDIEIERTEQIEFDTKLLAAKIKGNIGKAMVSLKSYKESITYLNDAISAFKELSPLAYNAMITDNELALAEAHLELNNLNTARRLLNSVDKNLTISQETLHNRLLGNYHDKTGNFQNALQYYKRNDQIADSLKKNEQSIIKQQLAVTIGSSNLENQLRLFDEQKAENDEIRSQLQTKSESFNLVIISLVFTLLGFAGLIYAYLNSIKNQRLIERQKYIIEDSLKEKESLLKEIHHRVKNNLQMVSSLLSLQTKNTKSKAAILALEEGKSRVKAMALIHQKLYQNDDLSVIEMQGYIESLINSVQSVYKKGGHNISITIDAEGTELDIDRAIPFGLILNELVSNTFKYAYPDSDENGKIYIHLRKNGDQGYFEYTDNGIGLPEEIDERTNASMGIRLINRLVNQLQSKLNIDKSVQGVRFWFTFS